MCNGWLDVDPTIDTRGWHIHHRMDWPTTTNEIRETVRVLEECEGIPLLEYLKGQGDRVPHE